MGELTEMELEAITRKQVKLPEVKWRPTDAKGNRHGAKVDRVVLHRWGARYTDQHGEALSYQGVIDEFMNPKNAASAHFVFPGSAVKGEITQMVTYREFAWTEEAYNPTSVEIENADAIWLGHDEEGLQVLAHITGYLLHRFDLPPLWSHTKGFCRHADLGVAGGDHLFCPTTDMKVWKAFCRLVKSNYEHGEYRHIWGR